MATVTLLSTAIPKHVICTHSFIILHAPSSDSASCYNNFKSTILYSNNGNNKIEEGNPLVLEREDEWEDYAPIYRDGTEEPPAHYIYNFGRKWTERLQELRQYKADHGDCMVPTIYSRNQPLANWVGVQRYQYDLFMAQNTTDYEDDDNNASNNKPQSKTKKSVLTEARIEALNALDFCWGLHAAPHTEWNVRFAELKRFKKQHKHCNVPKPYPANPALGVWVHTQRTEYAKFLANTNPNKNDCNLTRERMDLLNSIGFSWSLREEGWEAMFQDLVRYKAKYGDCNVPHPNTLNDNDFEDIDDDEGDSLAFNRTALGIWVSTQRADYKVYQQTIHKLKSKNNDIDDSDIKIKMFQKRMDRLNELNFTWDLHEASWWSMFDALKRYKQYTGDTLVPQKYDANPQLGYWVMNQRQLYRKFCEGDGDEQYNKGSCGGMNEERIEALEGIGFVWSRR